MYLAHALVADPSESYSLASLLNRFVSVSAAFPETLDVTMLLTCVLL